MEEVTGDEQKQAGDFSCLCCVTSAKNPLAKAHARDGPKTEWQSTSLLQGKGMVTGWDENWGLNGSNLFQMDD